MRVRRKPETEFPHDIQMSDMTPSGGADPAPERPGLYDPHTLHAEIADRRLTETLRRVRERLDSNAVSGEKVVRVFPADLRVILDALEARVVGDV